MFIDTKNMTGQTERRGVAVKSEGSDKNIRILIYVGEFNCRRC